MRSLLLLILLMPIFAFADVPSHQGHHLIAEKSGNIRLGGYSSTESMLNARHYVADNKDTAKWFNRHMSNMPAKTYAGAVTNSSLPAVLEHQVTKKAVMRSVFEKVVTVAKNPLGKSNFWTAAAGFAAVYLIDEFFLKDGEYVAVENSYFVIFENSKYSGIGEGSAFDSVKSYQYFCENGFSVSCTVQKVYSFKQVNSGLDAYSDYCKGQTWTASDGKQYSSDGRHSGGLCSSTEGNKLKPGYMSLIKINEYRKLTYDDFERLTLPAAESDPSPWVNYSRPSQNEAPPSFSYVGVTAQSGATASTDPYTDPFDGKAKQTKITVNSDGKSVTLDHTLRPDLQGQTDVAPVPTPIPDTDTEPKPETNPASTPVQCDKYPDTLGCEKMGDGSEAESIFSDIKIPEITNPAEFKLDNFLPDNGSCPAPKAYITSHGSIIYSYEKHCDVARTLRPFLIAFASVTALYLIFFRKA